MKYWKMKKEGKGYQLTENKLNAELELADEKISNLDEALTKALEDWVYPEIKIYREPSK